MSKPPLPSPKASWWPLVAGQAGGLALGLGLLWLESGGAFLGLIEPLDPLFAAALAAWPLSAAALVFVARRHGPGRPLWPVLVGLAPAALASGLAALSVANLGFVSSSAGACPLWLSLSFEAERLRLLGLLASGGVWLGCLPWLLAGVGARRPERPRWLLPLFVGLLLLAAVWTVFDPLLPPTGRVGGWAVRGLWPLILAAPAVWTWAQGLDLGSGGARAERGLALGLAAWAGLLACALGLWLLHRADGLQRLLGAAGPLAWPPWFDAGLALAAATWRLFPVAGLCWIVSFVVLGRRSGSGGLRRALAFVIVLGVLAVLAVAHERGFAAGYRQACGPPGATGAACAAERRVLGFCPDR